MLNTSINTPFINYKSAKLSTDSSKSAISYKTLPDGHRLAIVNKNGGCLIKTFVDTHKANYFHSHILEHLLADINNLKEGEFLESIGASKYAETAQKSTNYLLESPFDDRKIIYDLIKTQFNILNNKQNIFKSLQKEKFVLKSEYAFLEDNRKLSELDKEKKDIQDKTIKAIYQIDSVLNEDNGYSSDFIDKTSTRDLQYLYEKYYQPENMTTVVVSPAKPEEIEKEFLKYCKKNNIEHRPNITVKPVAKLNNRIRADYFSKNFVDDNIAIYFKAPDWKNTKDVLISQLIPLIINNNSNLFNIENFNANVINLRDDLIILHASSPRRQEEKTLAQINKQLTELTQKAVKQENLENAKATLLNTISLKKEIAPLLLGEIEKAIFNDTLNTTLQSEDIVKDITTSDIQAFAKKYLDINKSYTVVIHNPNILPAAFCRFSSPFLKNISFKSNMNYLDTGKFYEYKYPSNLRLTVNADKKINRASYLLKFDSKGNELTDNPVEMNVLLTLIRLNIEKNIDKKFKNHCHINFDNDCISIDISYTPALLKDMIQSLNSSIQNVSFDDKLVLKAKEKAKLYSEIDSILSKQYRVKNLDDSFQKITSQNLKKLYNDILKNCEANAVLIIPENYFTNNKNDILSLINKGFEKQSFPEKVEYHTDYFKQNSFEKTKVICYESDVNNCSVTQSFRATGIGPKKDLTLTLLNTVLGDSLNSIMLKELRLKKCLYICNSHYGSKDNVAYIHMLSEFKPGNDYNYSIKDALKDYKKFVSELSNGEIESKLFENAKVLVKANIAYLNNASEGKLSLLKNYDAQTYKKLYSIIDEITIEDIKQAAKEVLDKPSLIEIKAPKDVLKKNMPFLMTTGEVHI